ncbi:BUD22 family protein C4F10.06 [Tolypocladium paradoxum]|uniref:BUD22 family protein C4F10.06 n=1 Tax=Tolypocladium paradoxum TaxID=94208 RepID=A0A2S4L4D4_9HYPO|nr:BUD22 family protein C4F10.06 [Tolypocladium paradoxum]
MPKRKRSAETSLQAVLEKHQDDVFRALKAAKGFERQRLSKRLRDDGVQADKQERLEREIAVLKSLDLHQTARAHTISSLLKVKSVAASSNLPDELRRGVSKPELPEEERVALHNVTSGLYNKEPVKKAMDRAIAAVCAALNVPVPDKGKRSRKDKRTDKEEQPSDRIATESGIETVTTTVQGEEDLGETDFEGFETVDEPGPAIGEPDNDADEEETGFSKYDDLLGSSSDEEEFDDDKLQRFVGRETVNLDDISLSGSASDVESEQESESPSLSPSPPPEKKQRKESKQTSAAAKAGPARDSTFLPSLMGGYVSGSESASDIEDAKPKKRRGQRARRAIWEQKFGASAKHLQKPQEGGRDAGWDMRRGAVDGEDQGRKTPWKKGVHNPLARNNVRGGPAGPHAAPGIPEPKPTKRDDEGPLHPSWEARKKAQSQKAASFAGQKITFD